MTYEQALEFIHSTAKFGSKLGTERIEKILSALANPEKKCKVIHVAGTNGKGSITTMTANVLQNAGYKVGKFTSPFVYDFRERICINNQMIPNEKLTLYVEKIKNITSSDEFSSDFPTEFEIITAIAFAYFADENCDFICLEVGLGGLFDSTNVVPSPFLSVITKIGLDHTEYLGSGLDEIAVQKCGIIKNSEVVCYPLQDDLAMREILKYNPILPNLDQLIIEKCDFFGSEIIYEKQKFKVSLVGEHQIYNAITVIEICCKLVELGVNITFCNIYDAIESTKFNARMEVISNQPLAIFDGAHNRDGIDALCNNMSKFMGDKKITVVMGMLGDKDYQYCVRQISSMAENMIFVPVDSHRSADVNKLLECSVCEKSIACTDVMSGVTFAKLTENDCIICCGSLYLASEIKKYF